MVSVGVSSTDLGLPWVLPDLASVALTLGGNLHTVGTSTNGMSRVAQKVGRSSGTLRGAVWPYKEVERQNGSFHL